MDIESIKRRMLVKYPAFGSVVANLKYEENKECQTAATDGDIIYYNPEFLDRLDDDEKVFLFAHEVCHVAFNHIYRSEGKDKKLWNKATDAVINALLEQDGLKMIEGGVDIPEAVNFDAEEMYEKLANEKQNGSGSKSGKENSKDTNNNSANGSNNMSEPSKGNGKTDSQEQEIDENNNEVGHDSHSLWDKAIENKNAKESDKDNKKQNLWDKLFNKDNQENKNTEPKEEPKSASQKQKEEQIENATNKGEKETFKQNKIDRKKQLDELREALAKESIGAGSSTNSIGRNIGEIGKSKPLVDWRRLLKEAINANIDWSYKNATIEDGVVLSQLEEFPVPSTEIVLDTSGSINETLLRNFLRECKNILYQSKVKVGCFDTKFYGFNEILNEKDIENMEFLGGGGTNFDVAVDAFSRRIENKIIFTDGEARMPKKQMDAIWVVFGNTKINPKGGKVIYIDSRQLAKLQQYDMKRDMER